MKRCFNTSPSGEMDLSLSKRSRTDDTSNTGSTENSLQTTQLARLLIGERRESIPDIVQQNQQIFSQSGDASSESGDSSDPERLQVDMSQVIFLYKASDKNFSMFNNFLTFWPL